MKLSIIRLKKIVKNINKYDSLHNNFELFIEIYKSLKVRYYIRFLI